MKRITIISVLLVISFVSVALAADPTAKPAVVNPNVEKMITHLEFLGYKITQQTIQKDGKSYAFFLAVHPIQNNFAIVEFAPNFYNFRTNIISPNQPSIDMVEFINKANPSMDVSRLYCEPNDNNKGTSIKFDAVYVGEYSKQIFGAFIEMSKRDQESIRMMANYDKIFLKK